MEKLFNKIPLWIINALSLISAILTIISTLFTLFSVYKGWKNNYKFFFAMLCLFIVLLVLRIRKYQKIVFERQQITSFVYHRLTHISRDLYFDIMRYHKDKTESIRTLTDTYQNQLSILLSHLCDMMEKYCGQKTSSCIKLITQPEAEIKDITLTTFCRSTTSDTTRGIYESSNTTIKLDENTDFLYIVDPNRDSNLDYFYQGNLKDYAKQLEKHGKHYRNSNFNWENDYIGTIVVPIQIGHKHLYDTPFEDSLHIIGFLCIDSASSSAFLKRQEKPNVNMLKSFADIIYILLSQYQHYLKKLSETNNS
ncbi:MAG: hypothetical protein ACI4EJ_10445 [Bacteroides sp.]